MFIFDIFKKRKAEPSVTIEVDSTDNSTSECYLTDENINLDVAMSLISMFENDSAVYRDSKVLFIIGDAEYEVFVTNEGELSATVTNTNIPCGMQTLTFIVAEYRLGFLQETHADVYSRLLDLYIEKNATTMYYKKACSLLGIEYDITKCLSEYIPNIVSHNEVSVVMCGNSRVYSIDDMEGNNLKLLEVSFKLTKDNSHNLISGISVFKTPIDSTLFDVFCSATNIFDFGKTIASVYADLLKRNT